MCVPIYSNCDNVKLQNDSVTLTFEKGMWFLDATHRLDGDWETFMPSYFKIPQGVTKLQSRHEWSWDAQTDEQTDYMMPPIGGIKSYTDKKSNQFPLLHKVQWHLWLLDLPLRISLVVFQLMTVYFLTLPRTERLKVKINLKLHVYYACGTLITNFTVLPLVIIRLLHLSVTVQTNHKITVIRLT
jgi:hypothetical protein